MSQRTVITRFAPSPTGYLHIGNARTALFNFLLAKRLNGRFVIRSEDTDAERSKEKYLQAALADLAWMGMTWDAGPGQEDTAGPYRQSERMDTYATLYAQLEENDAAYPCFCTKKELELSRRAQMASGRPPRYDGRCLNLAKEQREARLADGVPAATRFHVESGEAVVFDDMVRGIQRFDRDTIGDFIIRRANGSPGFFFGNAVDDALMGISHVLRGEDHLTNTPRQILLLQTLKLPIPTYGHVSLLVGNDGAPLSKRHGSASVVELKEKGYLPAAIRNHMARLGHKYLEDGWLDDAGLVDGFETDRLGKSPAHFDERQLAHWQREAVAHADALAVEEWLNDVLPEELDANHKSLFLDVVKPNVLFPNDAAEWVKVVYEADLDLSSSDTELLKKTGTKFFAAAVNAFDRNGADLKSITSEVKTETGAKGKDLFMPLRVAITGRAQGPELAPLIRIMPQDIVRARLMAWAN